MVRYSDAFDDNGEVGADHVQELSSVSPASSSEVMSPPSVSMSTSDVSLEGENQLQNPPRLGNDWMLAFITDHLLANIDKSSTHSCMIKLK